MTPYIFLFSFEGLNHWTNSNIDTRDAKPQMINITNIIRLKEAGQKKYLSHNGFLTTSFVTTSFSQHLSHNVVIIPLPLHFRPQNVVLTMSRYKRNLSFLCSMLRPPYFWQFLVDQTETSTLQIYNLDSFTVWRFRTLGKRLHPKMPRTNYCISNVNRQTDGRNGG